MRAAMELLQKCEHCCTGAKSVCVKTNVNHLYLCVYLFLLNYRKKIKVVWLSAIVKARK